MRRSLLLLGLVALLATPTACKKESDEDRIKAVVRAAIAGADEKSASTVVADAAEDFVGPGKADLRECRRILMGFFLRKGWIRTFERELSVVVSGETATATLEVVVAEGEQIKSLEDVLPTNGTVLLFELGLVRVDGDWKFSTASYERVGLR